MPASDDGPTDDLDAARAGRARTLVRVAVGVVVLEAAVYLVLAGLDLLDLSSSREDLGLGTAVVLAVYGLAQVGAASQLLRWRTWSRGPLVLTQLVQLGLAWGLRDSDSRVLAGAMAVSAVAALVCLLHPSVTHALLGPDRVVED